MESQASPIAEGETTGKNETARRNVTVHQEDGKSLTLLTRANGSWNLYAS